MKQNESRPTPAHRSEPAPTAPVAEKAVFERPEVQKRGALPKVTTAFGGSFNP